MGKLQLPENRESSEAGGGSLPDKGAGLSVSASPDMDEARMNAAHNAGMQAFPEATRFRVDVSLNPYAGRVGYALEEWAWDLGWRLARFCKRGGG